MEGENLARSIKEEVSKLTSAGCRYNLKPDGNKYHYIVTNLLVDSFDPFQVGDRVLGITPVFRIAAA